MCPIWVRNFNSNEIFYVNRKKTLKKKYYIPSSEILEFPSAINFDKSLETISTFTSGRNLGTAFFH